MTTLTTAAVGSAPIENSETVNKAIKAIFAHMHSKVLIVCRCAIMYTLH